MTVEDKNRLITKYMGFGPVVTWMGVEGYKQPDLSYHNSWDWLMPVAYKIEHKGYSSHIDYAPGIGYRAWFHKDGAPLGCGARGESKIEAVYEAVVEAVGLLKA